MTDAAALLPKSKESWQQPVTISILFAIPRSKNSKLITPVGDGDNFEKALFDMLQKKGYLEDDRLITTCTWRKRFVAHGRDGFITVTIRSEPEEIDI
jgi:Holliday junction resolvase RusA-like endonuclease